MAYALGLDLAGGTLTAGIGRPEGASGHERDVLPGDAPAAEVDELLERLGDPVAMTGDCVTADGRTPDGATAASRLAGLVSASVRSVVAAQGADPDAVVVAHPAAWGPYRIGLLVAALREHGLHPQPLPAAAAAVAHEHDLTGVVAVLDVREEHVEVSVVASGAHGAPGTLLGSARTVADLGSADVDDAVLAHVRRVTHGDLAGTPPTSRPAPAHRRDSARPVRPGEGPAPVEPDGGAAARREALALRAACTQAGARLMTAPAATVTWSAGGERHEVRIVAGELDDSVRSRAGHAVAAAAEAVAAAAPGGVDRVLLVGRIAAMPLLAELVAERFEAPVTVLGPDSHAVARGAARVAARTAVATASAEPTGTPAAPVRRRRAHVRHTRRRPSGPVTVLGGGVVALGVAAMAVWATAVASPGSPAQGHAPEVTTVGSPSAVRRAMEPPLPLVRPPAVLGPDASPLTVPLTRAVAGPETAPAG